MKYLQEVGGLIGESLRWIREYPAGRDDMSSLASKRYRVTMCIYSAGMLWIQLYDVISRMCY